MSSVLIIEDNDTVRYGMEMLIEAEGDLRATGAARSLQEGPVLIAQRAPHLVIPTT